MKHLSRLSILLTSLFFANFCYSQKNTFLSDSPPMTIDIERRPTTVFLDIAFNDPNINNAIDAEEKGNFEVTLKNEGPGKAYALQVSIETVQGIKGLNVVTGPKVVKVLQLEESVTVHFDWSADEFLPDSLCILRVVVTEKFNNVPPPKELIIETRALVPPNLQITDVGIDDDHRGISYGNSNGKIEKGESVEVEAIVQNRGQGVANNVKMEVQSGNVNLFFLSKRDSTFGDLAPGYYCSLRFAFTVPPNYQGSERLPISLQISESRGRYDKTVPLELELNQPTKSMDQLLPERMVITGRERESIEIGDAPTLTVDVDNNIPVTGASRPDAVAVIIGNRDYGGRDVPNVDFAIRDATVVKEYVMKTLGYREGNILYLENATKAQIEANFGTASDYRGRLYSLIKRDKSEVFIYYSGHGAPDPESKQGYFVPVDCDPSLVRLNGFSLNTFYANLAKLKAARMLVVIDACFSGVSAGGTLMRQISPVRIKIENPLMTIPNAVVFTSATGDQVSSWYAEKKHSLFTYFFLKGLSGEADKNSDRALTLQELAEYVCDPTEGVPYWARRLHNREQTPTVIGVKADSIIKY